MEFIEDFRYGNVLLAPDLWVLGHYAMDRA